jgi:hypothetical protein
LLTGASFLGRKIIIITVSLITAISTNLIRDTRMRDWVIPVLL